MTATEHTRLPDAVLRGGAAEDPTVVIPVIPVVPVQYRPLADPYGPPAGLGGPVAPGYGPAQAPRSRRGLFVGGIVAGVAAAGLVAGVAAAASAASVMYVEGTFTLTDSGSSYYYGSSFTPGRSCEGDGGYSDIQAGTSVTVSDATGRVIATGALSGGMATSSSVCAFTFTVPDVPAGEDFYRLEVSHRGTLTYDADELAAGPMVTLGD